MEEAKEVPREGPRVEPKTKNQRCGLPEGIQRDKHTGRLKSGKKPRYREGVEDELVVIEHVMTRPAEKDKTYQHKTFRDLLNEDRLALLRYKSQLLARQVPEKANEVVVRDEGAERVLRVIEGVLKKAGDDAVSG